MELSERVKFQIDCLRSARYHEDRERFFARIHRATMFTVVASGTASLAWIRATPYLAGLITLVGLIDLVFDVSGKARLHASLRRRVYDLLAISENDAYPLPKLREQASQIYGDEPPCMHMPQITSHLTVPWNFGTAPKNFFTQLSGITAGFDIGGHLHRRNLSRLVKSSAPLAQKALR
jgi:hypothetical protein